jgi:hypothetical protein|tara:strand:- start:26 stop:271 length:246 start_codon:yes stop_codon:yes gene_type:complete
MSKVMDAGLVMDSGRFKGLGCTELGRDKRDGRPGGCGVVVLVSVEFVSVVSDAVLLLSNDRFFSSADFSECPLSKVLDLFL